MTPELLSKQLNLSLTEIIKLADEHTLAVQSWLSSRAPQAKKFAGQGIKASSTGLQVSLLNLALGCDFLPETSDDSIVNEILAVKEFFAERNVPWNWWIGPNPRPSNIAERLKQHGIHPRETLLPAMLAILPAQFDLPNPSITVWQAETTDDLAAASLIRRVAFRFPEGAATDYFEAMADSWLAGDPARLYLARTADSPPAAIGALIMGNDLPGVYVMATLPEWGRQGLGKAILARILEDAASDGHQMIALTASRFGFPLYQQFGFTHIFGYSIYSYSNSAK